MTMKKLILFCLMLVSFTGFSQEIHPVLSQPQITEKPIEEKSDKTDNIYNSVEKMPEYPGGITEFYKYVAQNYQIPREFQEQGVGAILIVNFIVETDGSLTNITVTRDLGFGTAEEAIRVLKKSKKWNPGIQEEKPVRVNYKLPIRLEIQ